MRRDVSGGQVHYGLYGLLVITTAEINLAYHVGFNWTECIIIITHIYIAVILMVEHNLSYPEP